MRFTPIVLFSFLPACSSGPLAERLAQPDVAIPAACAGGTTQFDVSGMVVDFVTGEPVAGATVDFTEAFTGARVFPSNGCLIAPGTVTDAAGAFGPISVSALEANPIVAFLVTGAGRAPTVHDKAIGCLLGCNAPSQTITAPVQELVDGWRAELYDGGMEYAFNRGLVAYKFHDSAGMPAAGVSPIYRHDPFADGRPLRSGSEVRFLEEDRATLGRIGQTTTLGAGTALIGAPATEKGYFRIAGQRGAETWASLGVMSATGWLYLESDSPEAPQQ